MNTSSATLGVIRTFAPVHFGAIPREEVIEPPGLTAGHVAKACGIARTRIERIVAEETGISRETAIRLGRSFGARSRFWMNVQRHDELERAMAARRCQEPIKRDETARLCSRRAGRPASG